MAMLRIRKENSCATEQWHELEPSSIHKELQEDTDYLIELGDEPEARIYVDDVELVRDDLGRYKWRPCFYAGRVNLEIVLCGEQAKSTQYLLDVSPNPKKSGQAAFDGMVNEIRDYDPSLLCGDSAASLVFGNRGVSRSHELNIVLTRLRAYGPYFLSEAELISRAPHMALAANDRFLPLSRVRRLHPSSLQDRRLAAFAMGHTPSVDVIDSMQVRSQTSTRTLDTPANRALLNLLRRFSAIVASMQDSIKKCDLRGTAEEQELRSERRLDELSKLENRASKLLRSPFFSEVTSSETTAAGLTQIAAQPTYSRAYRLGSRALARGIESDTTRDHLHTPPSWGVYESWCFIKVLTLVSKITNKTREYKQPEAVAAEQCWSFSLDDGSHLEVLFQATFPSLEPSSKKNGWSLSKLRRPDIVLVHRKNDTRRFLVLDAKWRSGRENVLDAMESAHIYHDSLRIGDLTPNYSLLLFPGKRWIPVLGKAAFIHQNCVGALSHISLGRKGLSVLEYYLGQWLFKS